MSTSDPDPPNDPPQATSPSSRPAPLDYQPPLAARPTEFGISYTGAGASVAQVFLAAIVTTTTGFGFMFCGAAVAVLNSEGHAAARGTVAGPDVAAWMALGVAALFVIAVNWLAVRWVLDRERRGLAIGIWLGQGLLMLVFGACFGAFR